MVGEHYFQFFVLTGAQTLRHRREKRLLITINYHNISQSKISIKMAPALRSVTAQNFPSNF